MAGRTRASRPDAVVPRPAATVMVVRDGPHRARPLEVLMLRRNARSDFAAGAFVFPGGAVDELDGGLDAQSLCAGLDDAAASATLGIAAGGLAYWVAAVRECFEEAGILLVVREGVGVISFEASADAERFVGHRRSLNAGARTFFELCHEERLRVAADRMHYFAHWITPEGLSRRYDTRFFVAAAPVGQTPAHDAAETVAHEWVRPEDALARHRAGTMELILPTVRNLQAIGRFPTAGALLEATRHPGEVPSVAPRMVADSEGLRLLLPGDPGYDRLPPGVGDPGELTAAARAASLRANAAPDPTPDPTPARMPETGRGPDPVPGRLDRLVPGLARLTAPNPGVMTGPGTNTYLVGSGELAVVDPGPDDAEHLDAIERAARALGGAIRWVLVTHTHPDHAPGAAELARRVGAPVIGHASREGFEPDVRVGDGWTLDAPSFRLTALHTPGHASDHLCWLVDGVRVLLSGDHVMDRVTVVVAPPDGDMTQYLRSLERVRDLDPPITAIAPGHGRLLDRPVEVVEAIVAHRLARESLVARALDRSGEATLDQLVTQVYADVDPSLHPVARGSLWAHLRKLVADGRAIEVGGEPELRYRAAPAGSAPSAGP